jgi:hypothetical protein
MLQKLSYLNIVLAIIYALVYLKNGTFNSTAGILVVIIFSWLGLRSYQLDNYRWKIWEYLTGLWSLYFIGTVLYGMINIVTSAIEVDYVSTDTLLYILVSILFSVSVAVYIIVYGLKNYRSMAV